MLSRATEYDKEYPDETLKSAIYDNSGVGVFGTFLKSFFFIWAVDRIRD